MISIRKNMEKNMGCLVGRMVNPSNPWKLKAWVYGQIHPENHVGQTVEGHRLQAMDAAKDFSFS